MRSVRHLHCVATKGNSSQTSLSRENKLQVGDVGGGRRGGGGLLVRERPSCWLS